MNTPVKIVHLTGILDSIQGNFLRQEINSLVEAGQTCVLIDFSEIELMDSSGLSALVMALQKVKSVGGTLGLYAINDQVRMLLELTAMDEIFKIFPKEVSLQSVTMG